MKYKATILLALLMISNAHGTCLDDVADFAEKMCGEISSKGSSSMLNMDGGLNAKAEGLLNKFLGEAGAEINLELAKKSYENVLRKDLGQELQNNRACRIKMVEIGQTYCAGELAKPELEYIKWPEGKKRYLVEAATVRPSCPEDSKITNHELVVIIKDKNVTLTIDGVVFKSRLIDDRRTILLSGEIPSEGGITSFKNAEIRMRNDKILEAEMDWIWKNQHGDVCTGALRIANSLEQRWHQ